MFQLFAKLVSHAWFLFLAGWIALAVGIHSVAPPWDKVAHGGQFDSLPKDSPSNRARELFRKAFPNETTNSSVVIILAREIGPLTDIDRKFAENVLRVALLDLAEEFGGLAGPEDVPRAGVLRPDLAPKDTPPKKKSFIVRVRNYNDSGSGQLLVSEDKQAMLVVIELTTDLLNKDAWDTTDAIETLVNNLRDEKKVPEGLEVGLTGSAVIGRDLRRIELASVKEVERTTVVLVVILLLIIYRAPLLALIPMLTVSLAVLISIDLLAIMAGRGIIHVSDTTRMYIIVVAYGAGVDYCLFLISRYREEMEAGSSNFQSVTTALDKTGHALIASAATVACGIAMLSFAEFAKYHQAGICIPFSLVIVLAGALTFTPSLLRLFRGAAFWTPRLTSRKVVPHKSWDRELASRFWSSTSRALVRSPGLIWLASVAALVPFAFVAVQIYDQWNYGITSALPRGTKSLYGTSLVQKHFSPGITGPVTVLLRNDSVDFGSLNSIQAISELTKRLERRMGELRIKDIRSVDHPHGISEATKRYRTILERESDAKPELKNILRQRSIAHYVSSAGELKRHVTRMDIVFDQDPLSRQSIADLARIEGAIHAEMPELLKGSEMEIHGPTASLRDLADVTTRDLQRIEWLVPLVVLLILVVLLGKFFVSLYLIASVIFSYLATLGVTHVLFAWLDPGFTALDWKVPIFLFTILVAVGEDYNIFLMTRVEEEEEQYGTIEGVKRAMISTGGIISSCGFIMAGTFAALLVGDLVEMKQLGFALSFGVILDTLVVRPLLVPAFLILLHRIKSKLFGARLPRPKAEQTLVASSR